MKSVLEIEELRPVVDREELGAVVGVVELDTPVSVTGQTVVPMTIVSVVTWPTGQFVTVDGQDVTV